MSNNLSPARERAKKIIDEYTTRTGRFAGLPVEERTDAPPTSEPTFKPTFPGTYQGTFEPTFPELMKGPERATKIKKE